LGAAFLAGSQDAMDPYTGQMIGQVSGAINTVNGLSGNAGTAGRHVGSSLGQGATQGTGSTASGMRGQVQAAVNAAGNVSSRGEGWGVGANFGSGLVGGIGSFIQSAVQRARDIVTAAKNAANAAQNSASPSKDMMKVGRWFAEGYAIGIENTVGTVVKSSADMVRSAKDEVEESSLYLSSLLDFTDDIDDSPVIRPVLDTSSIRAGMSDISYMLAQRQYVAAGYAASKQALAGGTASGAYIGGNNPQYNFYLQYDAGTDATDMVREMTAAVRQSSLAEGM
jgi:hypothetical protein